MIQEGEGEKTRGRESLYLFTRGWILSLLSVSSLSYSLRGVCFTCRWVEKAFFLKKFLFIFLDGRLKKLLTKVLFFVMFSTKVCLFRVGKAPQLSTDLFSLDPGGIST